MQEKVYGKLQPTTRAPVGTKQPDAVAHPGMRYDSRSSACTLDERWPSQPRHERTHKDKTFSFSEIGHIGGQQTHREDCYCFQLFTTILGRIGANFEWTTSARSLNGREATSSGIGQGQAWRRHTTNYYTILVNQCHEAWCGDKSAEFVEILAQKAEINRTEPKLQRDYAGNKRHRGFGYSYTNPFWISGWRRLFPIDLRRKDRNIVRRNGPRGNLQMGESQPGITALGPQGLTMIWTIDDRYGPGRYGPGQTTDRRRAICRGSSRRTAILKNEATDLIDNKGLALDRIRNEATDGRRKSVGGRAKRSGEGTGSYPARRLLAASDAFVQPERGTDALRTES